MAFDLSKINYRTVADPADFIAECDAEYAARIAAAADQISANRRLSPIVLLSGPSGSGKTTTAQKIEEELRRRGIKSYTISLDNYFRTVDPQTTPRTADGGYDFESPGCLDMDLLNEHFEKLYVNGQAGEPLFAPYDESRAHEMVVNRMREVIGGDAVGL